MFSENAVAANSHILALLLRDAKYWRLQAEISVVSLILHNSDIMELFHLNL